MSHCVPSWDLDENSAAKLCFRSQSNSVAPDVPMLDYEVAELTWENGQLAMHGLGPPRVQSKPQSTTWDKPRASGTLESIVNQATRLPIPCHRKPLEAAAAAYKHVQVHVPWFDNRPCTAAAASSPSMTMDALVPCSNTDPTAATHVIDYSGGGGGGLGGSSTRVGSCSGAAVDEEEMILTAAKRARVTSGSATFGTGMTDSQHVTVDTCGGGGGGIGFTSTTSFGSQENTTTSSGMPCTKTTTVDDHDSVCHSRPQREVGDDHDHDHDEDKRKGNRKSSVSNKRSRAAAIHNQSERKRRDKINQRMKTLQKLVPNSNKTDKASMLDEVIDYLKQLQAQISMMNRMNMSPMMMPMAMQQQLQMSMMAPMMGMGMGMGAMGMMDLNTNIARPNLNIPQVISPTSFMPMATSWDATAGDRLQAAGAASVMAHDPMSAFFAAQSQVFNYTTSE
ncbi:hypothetical protein ACFE04_026698 [Oxalis oulophora]